MRDVKLIPRDWYSVSMSSVQRLLAGIAVVCAFLASYVGYQKWQDRASQKQAFMTIEEAARLVREAEGRPDGGRLRSERGSAWSLLDAARSDYEEGLYKSAYRQADRSRLILESLLGPSHGDSRGEIRLMSFQGGVEYRRGERGSWSRARSQVRLQPGDWVQTSSGGSAEIMFADGSIYTLRKNTMVHLGDLASLSPSGTSRTDVVFGWVELDAEGPVTIATPRAETEVMRNSQAVVTFDQQRARGQFAAYEGGMKVTSASGERRELDRLQMVEQVGDKLSEARALPGAPSLISPAGNQEVDLDTDERVVLDWQDVEGARRYAVRVSTSRLFSSNLVEDSGRRRNRAVLGLRGEGSFYWQAAAIGPGGLRGPWSEIGTFRVASLGGIGQDRDIVPPALEIYEVKAHGSVVIVKGKTELGARVQVNGEAVPSLQVDGTFSKTLQGTREGLDFVEVVAIDAWGNRTEKRERVFIEEVF